jgi:hypothetical protein
MRAATSQRWHGTLRNLVPNIILELRLLFQIDRPDEVELVASTAEYETSENVRLSLKLSIVFLLLFLDGVTAVIEHPNWFQ